MRLRKQALRLLKQRPHYPTGILKRSFVSTVRPTVHNNPSRKRSFPKTFFKPEFKNTMQLVVFVNFLKPEFLGNDDVTIIAWFPWPSFPQTPIQTDRSLLCFKNSSGAAWTIVNRGDWLWSSANIKGANKDAKIHVGRSTTLQNLLFCYHTLCMNYVTNTFLLVSSSVRSKQLLCFVHGQG